MSVASSSSASDSDVSLVTDFDYAEASDRVAEDVLVLKTYREQKLDVKVDNKKTKVTIMVPHVTIGVDSVPEVKNDSGYFVSQLVGYWLHCSQQSPGWKQSTPPTGAGTSTSGSSSSSTT